MRPTREEYKEFIDNSMDWLAKSHVLPEYSAKILSELIYKKYLSDPNSVESPETKSE